MKAWPVELTLEELDMLLALPLEASIRHKMDVARVSIMRKVVADCGGTLIEVDLRSKQATVDLFLDGQLEICQRQGHQMLEQWMPCKSRHRVFHCTVCGLMLLVTCFGLPDRDATGAALHCTCRA